MNTSGWFLSRQFEGIDRRFDAIDQRFEAVDERFCEVPGHFDALYRRLERLEVARCCLSSSTLRANS